jgi:KDEL-tailed cysteine endopeptidase
MASTIILSILFALSSSIDCDFNRYISTFNKTYSPDSTEYLYRSLIYATNCTIINSVNANPDSTYTLRETKCTDLTEVECQSKYRLSLDEFNLNFIDLAKLPKADDGHSLRVSTVSAALPSSLNYNTLGYVTSIKNQGSCGCCWAFASVATYESWLLMMGHNIGLSEEASLECTYLYAVGRRMSDCTEGYITDAMDYLAKVGSVLRSSYPYLAVSTSSGLPSTPGICA